ncbi:MAG: RluA family pseudouridine synthase [Phycisphaerales bacterium]|nr:RluA family pseudouridine synthase [Phycisphaerales bacterium]
MIEAVPPPPISNPKISVSLFFEDDHLVAVEKPAGLVTQPGVGHRSDTLLNGLFARMGAQLTRLGSQRDWGLLHRLDRETSGLVIIAKTAPAYDAIRKQFEQRTIEKTYIAIVRGRLPAADGTCRQSLSEVRRGDMKISVVAQRGEHAVTHWKTLAVSGDLAVVACAIETGKLHQIRAHLALVGAPVVGDRVYRSLLPPNTSRPPANKRCAEPTLRLHAFRLGFEHPVSRKRIELEAPIPLAMREMIGECLGVRAGASLTPAAVAKLTNPIRPARWWERKGSKR